MGVRPAALRGRSFAFRSPDARRVGCRAVCSRRKREQRMQAGLQLVENGCSRKLVVSACDASPLRLSPLLLRVLRRQFLTVQHVHFDFAS